jgi:hypothetical protein
MTVEYSRGDSKTGKNRGCVQYLSSICEVDVGNISFVRRGSIMRWGVMCCEQLEDSNTISVFNV